MKPRRVLVVGASIQEIRALRDAAASIVGGETAMIALEAGRDSRDTTLVGSDPLQTYELADGAASPRPPVDQVRSGDADVWKTIIDAAHRHEVQAIVIAGHRRGWLRRIISGSAARDLLNHADIPILAVPEATLNPSA